MTPPKVFLLGLDGATWRVLDKLMAQGVMPNLAALSAGGAKGVLRSTIPYSTPVAWSSVLTGVRPFKHGIFGCHSMENKDGVILIRLTDRSQIKAPTVFDIYNQIGKHVISVNMPMTYPPQAKDGTVITGMMTPSKESRFYFPEDLMDELREQDIDYTIDIGFGREQAADFDQKITAYLADGAVAFLEDLRHVSEEREKTVLHLLATRQWDLFMVTLVSMDRIQHYLWNLFEDDDAYPELRRSIYAHYAYLDSVIGRFYEKVKDEAVLVVCSDHGFGNYTGNFYLDVWLEKKGYSAKKRKSLSPAALAKKVAKGLGISKVLRRSLERSGKALAKKLIFAATSDIDWSRTRAYVYSTDSIRINLEGRDQYGIVKPGEEFNRLREEIRDALLAIRLEDGSRLIEKVYFAEDLYGAAEVEDAPDIIYEFTEENHYATYYRGAETSRVFGPPYPWKQGDHRRDGIVLLAGEGVAGGKNLTADIEDILPTVMFIQNLPPSEDFDGRVISEAFTERFISERQDQPRRSFDRSRVEKPDGDKDDEVIDRLKGLGYI
jgi:predicted AlkP superfamily phosphohydrolase/phosphomutase